MTLPHDNATAKITIDGLAVCCFNKARKTWEIGYLHHRHRPVHTLLLHIEDENPIEIQDNIREITFSATNPQTPSFPGLANGFFDPVGIKPDRKSIPTTADDIEDFRWIINLQDPSDIEHGNATPKRAPFPVTRVFLHDAVCYTSRLSSKIVYRAPFTNRREHNPNHMNQATLEQHKFGRTNDQIAAEIFCATGNGAVTITIPGVLAQPRILRHRPGKPWNISLTNLCLRPVETRDTFEIGDFQLFYDVLTVTGQKQAIWGERPRAAAPDTEIHAKRYRATGRVDCDITWLGASETLDPIIP